MNNSGFQQYGGDASSSTTYGNASGQNGFPMHNQYQQQQHQQYGMNNSAVQQQPPISQPNQQQQQWQQPQQWQAPSQQQYQPQQQSQQPQYQQPMNQPTTGQQDQDKRPVSMSLQQPPKQQSPQLRSWHASDQQQHHQQQQQQQQGSSSYQQQVPSSPILVPQQLQQEYQKPPQQQSVPSSPILMPQQLQPQSQQYQQSQQSSQQAQQYQQQNQHAQHVQQPQQHQEQPQQSKLSLEQQREQQLDKDVAASIARDKAAAVPTMSHSMLEEFNARNESRMSRMTIGSEAPKTSNPFEDTSSVASNSQPQSHQQSPPPQQQQPSRNRQVEETQLVGMLVGYLQRRREHAQSFGPEPAQEFDLIAQVEVITGLKWSEHWQQVHGSMMDFVGSKPDTFSVVQGKYIVLRGLEHEVAPPVQQQQQQAPIYAAPTPQYHQDPFVASQAPPLQQSYMPSTNPFMSNDGQGYSYPPPNTQYQAPVASGFDDGWDLFGDSSDLDVPISNPFGGTGASVPWGGGQANFQQVQDDSNPLAAFETPSSDNKSQDTNKEDKMKKRLQETEDELLARKLQEEEDAAYARASNSSSTSRSGGSDAPLTKRVALTHTEVREMAEKEIGKDNIRILAGFSVIKFGREGRPHQRKMWINSALTHLAWESAQFDGSHRGLELAKVVDVQIGEMTPTIKRSTKDLKKVRTLCFSLNTHARTLDLQACSVIQRDALAAALKKVVEFNHRHKPRRVDKLRTEVLV